MLRPRPVPDEITRPFWEFARRGVLAVQRCRTCRSYQHPPRPLCLRCFSHQLEFEPVSGRGKLWSFTVTRHPLVRGFEELIPYVCLVVQLEEQPDIYMVSDWRPEPDELARLYPGLAMRVVFEPADEGLVLPQFRPEVGP